MGNDVLETGSLSYETAIGRLREVVFRLENGELPLEEAITLFQEGISLVKTCQEKLDAAEHVLALLVEGPEGEPEEKICPDLEVQIEQLGR